MDGLTIDGLTVTETEMRDVFYNCLVRLGLLVSHAAPYADELTKDAFKTWARTDEEDDDAEG